MTVRDGRDDLSSASKPRERRLEGVTREYVLLPVVHSYHLGGQWFLRMPLALQSGQVWEDRGSCHPGSMSHELEASKGQKAAPEVRL